MTTETLLTIRKAADALNLPYRQLLEQVNIGSIPSYQVGKSRRMVFMSEVLTSICSKQTGEF